MNFELYTKRKIIYLRAGFRGDGFYANCTILIQIGKYSDAACMKKNHEDCTEPVKSGEKYGMIILVCG